MKDFEKNLFKVQKFLKQNSHVSADICTLNIGYYDANLLSAIGFLSNELKDKPGNYYFRFSPKGKTYFIDNKQENINF